jgi:hypothetical protein
LLKREKVEDYCGPACLGTTDLTSAAGMRALEYWYGGSQFELAELI